MSGNRTLCAGEIHHRDTRDKSDRNALDPVDFLKFVMDEKALKQTDLVQYIGNKSTVSQIMNRRRSMTVEMIRKLSRGLSIPVQALVGI